MPGGSTCGVSFQLIALIAQPIYEFARQWQAINDERCVVSGIEKRQANEDRLIYFHYSLETRRNVPTLPARDQKREEMRPRYRRGIRNAEKYSHATGEGLETRRNAAMLSARDQKCGEMRPCYRRGIRNAEKCGHAIGEGLETRSYYSSFRNSTCAHALTMEK